jgi:hypothetical protein
VVDQLEHCREDDSCVRIGVVGHRTNRLTAKDLSALERRISDAMDALQQIIGTHQSCDGSLQPEVVTSLAEGTDRLVARKAVELGLLEIVVLPFQRDRFERDFHSDESLHEFRELLEAAVSVIEPAAAESQIAVDGYETASAVIIDCADLMIAVWDGRPGRGAGGTADTVSKALQRSRPVIWIHSREPYVVEILHPDPAQADPVVGAIVNELAKALGADGTSGSEDMSPQVSALVR